MFHALQLHNFKNFQQATLALGPFTVLVGANASGKSNLRDAFRFLHGIGRGYSLAEILGQKWGDEGVLLWRGIRGGPREAAFHGADRFALTADLTIEQDRPQGLLLGKYMIECEPTGEDGFAKIARESLYAGKRRPLMRIFETDRTRDPHRLKVEFFPGRAKAPHPPTRIYSNAVPILSQVARDHQVRAKIVRSIARGVLESLICFRFLDLSPEAMRVPALPGQTVLGDRGENLSSVLLAICADESKKRTLIEWVKELTPMDAKDFAFPTDQAGRVLLALQEQDGKQTSAYSTSDGTLRFLAMLAALLGPEPARHYFFEELDNGIHPTRLSLLLELIERQVARKQVQVITTTHSPMLLELLNPESLSHAALIYRLQHSAAAGIRRIQDLPDAERVIKEHTAGRLLASGWLENAAAFTEAAAS